VFDQGCTLDFFCITGELVAKYKNESPKTPGGGRSRTNLMLSVDARKLTTVINLRFFNCISIQMGLDVPRALYSTVGDCHGTVCIRWRTDTGCSRWPRCCGGSARTKWRECVRLWRRAVTWKDWPGSCGRCLPTHMSRLNWIVTSPSSEPEHWSPTMPATLPTSSVSLKHSASRRYTLYLTYSAQRFFILS